MRRVRGGNAAVTRHMVVPQRKLGSSCMRGAGLQLSLENNMEGKGLLHPTVWIR
jgi:hypothetical protein